MEFQLSEARSVIEVLQTQLSESEASRADDANRTNAEIHRLRREVAQVPAGFDATFKRNSAGLIEQLDVHIGNDTFSVIPVRTAAGHIIEMRRESKTEKVSEVVKTALSHSASRRAAKAVHGDG